MSTLLTTLMTYSRLSSDSELIALRSCGVAIGWCYLPLFSAFSLRDHVLFNEQFVPAANYQATLTLERAKEEKPTFQDRNIYPEYQEVKQPDGDEDKCTYTLILCRSI